MAKWVVGAARDLPVKDGGAWDAAAAQARVWTWAGWKGNTAPDKSGGKARQAFLLVDDSAADQKGSYSLPFADVVDGKLTAIGNGVRNAASRLPQKQGVSDDIRGRARAVLDAYLAKLNEKKASSIELVTIATINEVRAPGAGASDIKAMLAKHVLDPSVLDAADPLTFGATVSTNKLDSYGTRMQPSSLKNFAAEAGQGVPLLTSHNNRVLPLGHSYSGNAVGGQGDGVAHTDAGFYMMPGWSPDGTITTDHVHEGLRWGNPRDMSVGFMVGPDGDIRCSFCGLPMLWAGGGRGKGDMSRDALCFHMPGWSYPKLDKAGKPTNDREVAEGLVDNAHLIEASLVYAGATPGAGVYKARLLAEAALLTRSQVDAIEQHYRMVLPGAGRVFPVDLPFIEQEERMDPRDEREASAENPELLREVEALRRQASDAVAAIRALLGDTAPSDVLAGVRALIERVTALTPLAADGEQYRKDLIEQAVTEGKRALPDRFSETLYRSQLERADVAFVKAMRDDWKAQADKLYPAGRATTDDQPGARNGRTTADDSAAEYRVGR